MELLNRNSYGWWCLMLLLLLPLLWINKSTSQDWGGDFAMYLMQARNFVEGQSQVDTGYIYNPDFARNGPQTYPAGYPLMLAPLYSIWGNNMAVFSLFQSILAVLFGLSAFALLKRHFSLIASVVLVVIVVYNPWFLVFKREVMSDLPFALVGLWFLFFLERHKHPFMPIVLAIAMVMIRGIGWIAIPVLVAHRLTLTINGKANFKELLKTSLGAGIATVVILIIEKLVFKIPSSSESYADQLLPKKLIDNVVGNSIYFYEVIQDHLFRYLENNNCLFTIAMVLYLAFFALGMLRMATKFPSYFWFLLFYFAVILIYPYRSSGFRFIFPIHTTMLLSAGIGVHYLLGRFKPFKWAGILVGTLLFATYIEWWIPILKHQDLVQNGPQHPASKEMFEYIKSNSESSGPILFNKPRVLNLYTGRRSLSNETWSDGNEIPTLLQKHQVSELLLCSDLPHPGLERYVDENIQDLHLLFENDRFRYFSIKQPMETSE